VYVQDDVCNGCGYCVVGCPFGVIDRRSKKEPVPGSGGAFKCTFCYDRQLIGLTPACAKVCPTETLLLLWIEFKGKGVIDAQLRHGRSGWMIRIAGVLLGPIALVLRLFGLIPFAAAVFLIGALINRYGWLQAGRDSARDPEALFAAQKQGVG
jgi:hypothetical protein